MLQWLGLYKKTAILATSSSPLVGCLQSTHASTCRLRSCLCPWECREKHLPLAGQSAGEPVQAFVKTIARGGASRLDEPLPAQIVQAQLLCHLGCSHRIWQILLVGEDQENRITHLLLVQHLGQLLTGIFGAVTIVAVDHIDDAVRACEVVAPEWANPVLAADIPHGEAQVP